MRLTIPYLAIAILIFTGANNVLGQSERSAALVPKEHLERLVNLYDSSMNLYKDLRGTIEGLPHNDMKSVWLYGVAERLAFRYLSAIQYIDSAGSLLVMCNFVTDPHNKEMAKELVNDNLGRYSKFLEITIETINIYLAQQENPAIIAIGMRMKDQLREGQEVLRSAIIK